MRRVGLVPTLLVVLAAAASTFAATAAARAVLPRDLVGAIDPSGAIEMTITKGRDFQAPAPPNGPGRIHTRVVHFRATGIPLACDDGLATTYDFKDKSLVVKFGGLGFTFGSNHEELDSEGNRKSTAFVGLLEKPTFATGVVKVRTVDATGRDKIRCRSGRLPWSATKVAGD